MIFVDIHKSLRSAGGPLELSVRFELGAGETLGIYGPSGAGKTSTLRMIAGLLDPDGGKITYKSETWFDGESLTPSGKRGIGFVFQDYALFPHLSVEDNLRYANREGDGAYVRELLDVFHLAGLERQRPPSLSGGQRQRLALARALAQRPRLLLLDEPLSALDDALREELQTYLMTIRERFSLPTLLISHDRRELLRLADRLLVLEGGRLTYTGSPQGYFPDPTGLIATVIAIAPSSGGDRLTVELGADQIVIPATSPGISYRIGQSVELIFSPGGVQIKKASSE